MGPSDESTELSRFEVPLKGRERRVFVDDEGTKFYLSESELCRVRGKDWTLSSTPGTGGPQTVILLSIWVVTLNTTVVGCSVSGTRPHPLSPTETSRTQPRGCLDLPVLHSTVDSGPSSGSYRSVPRQSSEYYPCRSRFQDTNPPRHRPYPHPRLSPCPGPVYLGVFGAPPQT